MELTTELKALFIETAETLKSSDRRIFMAQVVKMLGWTTTCKKGVGLEPRCDSYRYARAGKRFSGVRRGTEGIDCVWKTLWEDAVSPQVQPA